MESLLYTLWGEILFIFWKKLGLRPDLNEGQAIAIDNSVYIHLVQTCLYQESW